MRVSTLTLSISLGLLLSIPVALADYCCDINYAYNKTHFSQRPQGNYYFATLMATADKTHCWANEENYALLSATLGYRRNFDQFQTGRYFFTQTGPLVVGPVNTNVDVENLQLGLAPNYLGSAILNPIISDFIADFDLFVGLDQWRHGMWFRINAPIVHTSWNTCIQTTTAQTGKTQFAHGFADITSADVSVAYHDVMEALCGNKTFGKIPALCAGKLCCGNKKIWGLSDLHLELGYDFIQREHGNMGIALIGAIPTGRPTTATSCCSYYLLAPSIGSQRSGQLGFALRGQYCLLHDSDDKDITLYADARFSHLFSGRTMRLMSLDVGNSTAFNYWLLLNHYAHNGTFLGVERAANMLNKCVKVDAACLGELTVMLATEHKNRWQGSIGYNLWFRTKEHLCMLDNSFGNTNDYYTIKQTNNGGWGTASIDKAYGTIALQPVRARLGNSLADIQQAAIYPGAIDRCVAQHPTTYSNTIFGYIGYHEQGKHRLDPYIGLGAHAEFGRGNIALSTWGLYLKGGIIF